MTTKKIDLSAEQLRAELARIEAEENAELARRADVLKTRQDDYDQHVLDTWKQIDQELQDEAKQKYDQGADAVFRGDLNEAFRLYSMWHASRLARYHLRTAAVNAANRLGVVVNGVHELRSVDFDFTGWLNDQGYRASERHGATTYEQVYGEFPTTYDDVAATDPLTGTPAGQEG